MKVGEKIGKFVKIDEATSLVSRVILPVCAWKLIWKSR